MIGFITVTPLQLKIVESIIGHEAIRDFAILNINAHDSARLRHAYSQLSARSVSSHYIIANQSAVRNILAVAKALFEWKKIGVNHLSFASVDNILVRFSANFFHKQPFSTFDDGAVNINLEGVYHKPQKPELPQSLYYGLLEGKAKIDYLKKNTQRHYTLFDSNLNIVSPTKLVKISINPTTSGITSPQKPKNGTAKVFLGFDPSPLYELAVDKIQPDYYLPHPMEPKRKIGNVVETTMIAEEFVLSLLNEYESILLYSCKSTALLTIHNPRVKKIVVDLETKFKGANIPWQTGFNIAAEKEGCVVWGKEIIGG